LPLANKLRCPAILPINHRIILSKYASAVATILEKPQKCDRFGLFFLIITDTLYTMICFFREI